MLITSWYYDERSQEFRKTSLKELKRLEYGNKEEFLYIKERLYRSQNKSVPMILVRKGLNQGFRRKGNSTGNHTSKSRGECESLTHQGNKEALATVDELIIMFNDEKVTLFIKSVECQTAHCGRYKQHIDFGIIASPIVPYRHLPQTLRGLPADCRSLISKAAAGAAFEIRP